LLKYNMLVETDAIQTFIVTSFSWNSQWASSPTGCRCLTGIACQITELETEGSSLDKTSFSLPLCNISRLKPLHIPTANRKDISLAVSPLWFMLPMECNLTEEVEQMLDLTLPCNSIGHFSILRGNANTSH
jgi:hypothetical protein